MRKKLLKIAFTLPFGNLNSFKTVLSGRLSVTAGTVSLTRQPPDSITFSELRANVAHIFFSLTQPSHFHFMPSLPSVINLTSLQLLQVPVSCYTIILWVQFNLFYLWAPVCTYIQAKELPILELLV